METAELAKLIKSRRSVRSWQERPVPEDLLWQAVEMATWAPNGGNQQNWHFHIILKKETIQAIADAAQAGRELMNSWPETAQGGAFPPPPATPPPGPRPAGPRPGSFTNAPALIVVSARKGGNPMDRIFQAREKTDPKAAAMRQWSITLDARVQSVSAAIAYLLLVLHQMGLGAVWMTGPLTQSKGDVEKVLNLSPDMDVLALIPVGYPAETPTRDRKPVKEVCEVVK
jgi:nitroreductase